MTTYILEYAKISPIAIIDAINIQFGGRVVARWIDFDRKVYGIRIVANEVSKPTVDDIKWIENHLFPFRYIG